ncbi:hypothetical protein SLEP1_g49462 [Rubroshorea leprosula]|uniref:Uncharacterized protein n=1 Tax=Rubroshorea leprosula TaxID=152421 RepID=A0AAV5LXP4_9ROSI|nr:hypothetical protein SLEP1_g49462 [Rubroshorea leprosula]
MKLKERDSIEEIKSWKEGIHQDLFANLTPTRPGKRVGWVELG